MKRALAAIPTIAVVAVGALGCPAELPLPATCHDIPAGGCPRRDDACKDPSCTAVYYCSADAKWVLDHTCAEQDGGEPLDAARDVAAAPTDAGVDSNALTGIPGASGGPGCETLDQPDCPLATAASCNACCGCEDLFVCESGGWSLWGRCDNGVITPDARDR